MSRLSVVVGPTADGRFSATSLPSLLALSDTAGIDLVNLRDADPASVDGAIRAGAERALLCIGPFIALDQNWRRALDDALDSAALATPWTFGRDGLVRSIGIRFTHAWTGLLPFRPVDVFAGLSLDAAVADDRLRIAAPAHALVAIDRDAYVAAGGLDPGFEDLRAALVDLALRLKTAGKVTLSVAGARFVEDGQAGVPISPHDWREVLRRHPGTIVPDAGRAYVERGVMLRLPPGPGLAVARPMAPVAVGVLGSDRDAAQNALAAAASGIGVALQAWFIGEGVAATAAFDSALKRRGDRMLAIVDPSQPAQDGWLADLLELLASDASASAARNEQGALLLAADAFPAHERPKLDLPVTAAIEELLARAATRMRPTRGARPARALPVPRNPDRKMSVVFVIQNNFEVTRHTFDTLLARAGTDDEIFVVHDGTSPLVGTPSYSLDVVTGIFSSDRTGVSGVNEALARAKSRYIVVMTDAYMLAPGYAENAIAVLARDDNIGIVVPRVNALAGGQAVFDASYQSPLEMRVYAQERARERRGKTEEIDAVAEAVLAFDRRLIETIGGFRTTPRATWGDLVEEFVLRARAAGYRSVICEDTFAHRMPAKGGDITPLPRIPTEERLARVARGFELDVDRVPLPDFAAGAAERIRLVAVYRDEADWRGLAAAVRPVLRRCTAEDGVVVSIAVADEKTGSGLAANITKLARSLGLELERVPDIAIEATSDVRAWAAELGGVPAFALIADEELSALPRLEVRRPADIRAAIELAIEQALTAGAPAG